MTGMRAFLEALRPPIHHPPSIELLWNYRRRPPTTKNVIHAANAAYFWRLWRELGVSGFANLYLMWLYRFPIELIVALKRYGPAAKRMFGRGIAAQAWDLICLAAVNWLPRKDYYSFGVARHALGPAAQQTMAHHVFFNASTYIGLATLDADALCINNKAEFFRFCRDRGFSHPTTYAIVTENNVRDLDHQHSTVSLPHHALFCKPVRNFNGRGASLWRFAANDTYRNHRGESMTERQMLESLRVQARQESMGILIQDCLENHPDLEALIGPGLGTFRVVSIINERQEPEIGMLDLKTLGTIGGIVNNLGAGGVLFRIDIETGKINFGVTNEFLKHPVYLDTHPLSNRRLKGASPPGLEAACILARDLHRALPWYFAIGWDIAYTLDGASVLEANYGAGMNQEDFFRTRMAELTAWHARRALDTVEPRDSRWRVGAGL